MSTTNTLIDLVIIIGPQYYMGGLYRSELEEWDKQIGIAATSGEWLRLSNDFGSIRVRGDQISGWYFRSHVESPNDRVAAAFEKLTSEGENWKG